MKLWVLKPVENLKRTENPWLYLYDTTLGLIIRAKTEENARKIANKTTKKEGLDPANPWLNPKYTICVELLPEGKEEVILSDFLQG